MKKLALTVCLLAVFSLVTIPHAMGNNTVGQQTVETTASSSEAFFTRESNSIKCFLALLNRDMEGVNKYLERADIHYTLPHPKTPLEKAAVTTFRVVFFLPEDMFLAVTTRNLQQQLQQALEENQALFGNFENISIYDVSPVMAAKAMGIDLEQQQNKLKAQNKAQKEQKIKHIKQRIKKAFGRK